MTPYKTRGSESYKRSKEYKWYRRTVTIATTINTGFDTHVVLADPLTFFVYLFVFLFLSEGLHVVSSNFFKSPSI